MKRIKDYKDTFETDFAEFVEYEQKQKPSADWLNQWKHSVPKRYNKKTSALTKTPRVWVRALLATSLFVLMAWLGWWLGTLPTDHNNDPNMGKKVENRNTLNIHQNNRNQRKNRENQKVQEHLRATTRPTSRPTK